MKSALIALLKAMGHENISYSGKARRLYFNSRNSGKRFKIGVSIENYSTIYKFAVILGKVSQGKAEFAIANSTNLVKPMYRVWG